MNKLDTIVLAALIALAIVCAVVLVLAGHDVPGQLWAALTALSGGLLGRMLPSIYTPATTAAAPAEIPAAAEEPATAPVKPKRAKKATATTAGS